MKQDVQKPDRGQKPVQRSRAIMLGVICALVGFFYFWTARNEGVSWNFGQRQTDYYNLLAEGFLDGHLYLNADVPEELLTLADPYNPGTRPPGLALHDASLYRGRYYIYFGAAPVVTLILPFRVLTGTALPLPAAVVVFTFAGFLMSVAIFVGIRQRYFLEASWVMVLGWVLTLGIGSMGPLLVLRGSIWELPLSSGYFFVMAAVYCVSRSVHAERRAAWWFAAAGLSLGLAVASRPSYLFASGLLVPPIIWWWRVRATGPADFVKLGRFALAGAVPLGAVGLAMAWYNYARFGSPTEFGVAYQLSGVFEAETRHFSWSYLAFNARMYWLSAAEWVRYFPFFHRLEHPAVPVGHVGFDDVYGLWRNLPVVWFALLAPLALWRREAEARGRLMVGLGATALLAAGAVTTLLFFYAAMARYGADFLPAILVLAGTGLMALERWMTMSGGRNLVRWMVRTGVLAAMSVSLLFAVMLSFSAYGNLKRLSPRAYARIALWSNYPSWWLESLMGTAHGPLEMEWRFSPKEVGTRETLVRTGTDGARDEIVLVHETGGIGRIVFTHEGGAGRTSGVVSLDGGAGKRLRMEMGSLYPPENHPFFSEMSAAERMRLARRLVVTLGGEILFDGYQRFHPSSPRQVIAPGGRRVGGIEVIRASVKSAGSVEEREFEAIQLRVAFPVGARQGREPLVVTGETGRGDFLFVEYLDDGRIRFGLDHWGKATVLSAPLSIERGKEYFVAVELGSFPGATKADRLEVKVDGVAVWQRQAPFFSVGAEDVFVGKNPIGGTGCAESFSGTILEVVRGGKPDLVR